jgi:HK97 family phage major capsid protein
MRQFGYEVLEHTSEAIDMTRLLSGAAVLVDHGGDQVGVVRNAWLDGNKLRADVKFSKGVRGQEIEQDIRDGIRRNVSIGYMVNKWDEAKTRKQVDGVPVYRAVSWTPFEVSIVAVPADHTVGVGRAFEDPSQLETGVDVQPTEVPVEEETKEIQPTELIDVVSNLQEQVNELTNTVETIVSELVTEEASETESETSEEVTSEEVMTEDENTEASDSADLEAAEDDEEESPSRNIHIPLMESNTMKNNLDNVQNSNIKLTEKEQRQYSLSRAILSAADGKRSGLEFEISDEIAKKTGRDSSGLWMPTSIRAYDITDAASAGAMTFTQGGEFIDFLRAKATVAGLGASVLSLNAKTALPRATSDLSAQWIAEDGSGATYNSQSFDQMLLSPKKLATYTGVTREALTVASLDVENVIRTNIYNAFTVAFDRAAIQGAGGNSPTGLLNQTGLVSGTLTGVNLTYAAALDLFGTVAGANADQGNMSYLTTPAIKAKAMATIKAGSSAEFIINDAQNLSLFNVAHSNNVTTGNFIFGDWSSLVLAEFGAIEIVVDPYTSKHKGIVEVGATMLGDVGVKTVRSFAILKGLTVA